MTWATPCVVLAVVLSVAFAVDEQEEKPRALYEIAAENAQVGLDPFYEGNMEPWGAVCIAYVKLGSPNYKLIKRIASLNKADDEMMYDLQIPTAAALNWQPEESLEIVKRDYAKVLWDSLNETHMDGEPIRFPAEPGQTWKFKAVRQWLLDNAFPRYNYRVHGYANKKQAIPFNKYFGKSNTGGAGMVFADLGKQLDFEPQWRVVRALKPYMDELTAAKIHIAVVEKSKATLKLRRALKMGLDETVKEEFVLIEEACMTCERERDNYAHGNPKKYRLTNFSAESVTAFMEGWRAKTLPTYWGSAEEDTKMVEPKVRRKRTHGNLTAWNFEEFIYGADPKQGVLVAFWNSMKEHGCPECAKLMKVWSETAEQVQRTQTLKRLTLASIDQSVNEHPERLVPGRLGDKPMIVYYPPGTPEKRKKRKHTRESIDTFIKEDLLEKLDDINEEIEDAERNGEL